MIGARAGTPLTVALALLALLAAGCGDGDGEATDGAGATTTTTGREAEVDGGRSGGDRGGISLRLVGRFEAPLYVTQPPAGDDHLYVVEQGGTVRRVAPDGSATTFLDVSSEIVSGGEQGLLSIAFAPDYVESGLLYANFTDRAGDTRVVEYRSDGERVGEDSARELLRVEQPHANHNGGLVAFGPDGHLYVGMGDGGSADDPDRNGQDLGTLLGKLLRIDPRPDPANDRPYSIPRDNPFVDRSDALPEIYALGLRNPWRFSFDEQSGLLTIGDVGQDREEEIDVIGLDDAAGANFGWSAFEGRSPLNEDQTAPGAVEPALVRTHEDGYCSIVGGLIVRDASLAELEGRYVYGDLCRPELRSFSPQEGERRDDRPLGVDVPQLVSFGSDAEDRVYAVSIEGPVYELLAD